MIINHTKPLITIKFVELNLIESLPSVYQLRRAYRHVWFAHFFHNFIKMVKRETSLKQALWPLFIVSKLFGICPFSIRHERISYVGTFLSTVMLISYCSFHFIRSVVRRVSISIRLYLILRFIACISVSGELTDNSSDTNFVTMTINSFNRYSGIVSLFVISVMGIVHQTRILNAVQIMHSIDSMFRRDVNIQIDDSIYSRYENSAYLSNTHIVQVDIGMCVRVLATSYFFTYNLTDYLKCPGIRAEWEEFCFKSVFCVWIYLIFIR